MGQVPAVCAFSTLRRRADEAPFGELQYREALLNLKSESNAGLALYVHVPFCHVRCLYCACNTTITHSEERVDQYLDALDREMAMVSGLLGGKRAVDQLHVGGGTPNHLNEPQLARLVEIVERYFDIAPNACTSIECNPRRTSAGQLDLLYGLGFKQVSFGVQDLNSDVQRAIGRVQSLDMVRDVFLTARETGFDTINLDLIYGLPLQTSEGFQDTLERVLDLNPDRIACFSYSHDPVNRPHQHAIDIAHLPTAEEKLHLFQQAVGAFSAAGYRWIGLDVFARPSDELSNAQEEGRLYRNAIGYTASWGKPVLGFGPSGLGEIGGALVQNAPDLKTWQRLVDAGRLPVLGGRSLSERDRRRREAILRLMCNLELPSNDAEWLALDYESLSHQEGHSLLELTPNGIRVTPEGRYLLHAFCVSQDASIDWVGNQWRATVRP